MRSWYDEMPKVQRLRRVEGVSSKELQSKGKTIEAFMKAAACIVCRTADTENGKRSSLSFLFFIMIIKSRVYL